MIETDTLATLKPGVSIVICRERHNNYDYGWADEMDDMVNRPYTIYELKHEAIVLQHENGKYFTFHRKILDLYEEPCVTFKFKDIHLSGVKQLTSTFLEQNCLSEDFAAMKKILKTKKTILVSETLLETIDKQCPRVLGVLISNNKLTKQVK